MNDRIPPITFRTDTIPETLKVRRQWLNWRYDLREEKLVKIPCAPYLNGELYAVDATDPTNLTVFEEAVEYAKKHGIGIGYVFFKADKVTGIDLDINNDETQAITKEANSYTEHSPSGRGFHIIVGGKPKENLKEGYVEAYGDGRYFAFTGDHLKETPLMINQNQEFIDRLVQKYRSPEPEEGYTAPRPHKALEEIMGGTRSFEDSMRAS